MFEATQDESTLGVAIRVDPRFPRREEDGVTEYQCSRGRRGPHWTQGEMNNDAPRALREDPTWHMKSIYCTDCGVVMGTYYEKQ